MRHGKLFVLSGLFALGACDDSPTEPFCADVNSPATLQLTSETTGFGTIQSGPLAGGFSVQITKNTPGANNTRNLEIRQVFATSPGDTLFTQGTGVLTPTSQTEGSLTETLAVERGTGRFRSAQGTFTATATANFQTGAGQATFAGQLCGLRR
jgi:hypothetical protein